MRPVPDPRSVDRHLTGQPWFVVRNLATVLAKTGQLGATPGLRQLMGHDDYRVTVEALRGLMRIGAARPRRSSSRCWTTPTSASGRTLRRS